jgi:hypothetical protein
LETICSSTKMPPPASLLAEEDSTIARRDSDALRRSVSVSALAEPAKAGEDIATAANEDAAIKATRVATYRFIK